MFCLVINLVSSSLSQKEEMGEKSWLGAIEFRSFIKMKHVSQLKLCQQGKATPTSEHQVDLFYLQSHDKYD